MLTIGDLVCLLVDTREVVFLSEMSDGIFYGMFKQRNSYVATFTSFEVALQMHLLHWTLRKVAKTASVY